MPFSHESSSQQERSHSATMNTSFRCLQMEANHEDAQVVQQALQKAGLLFELRRVDNQPDFIAALHDFQPDMVLTSYRLPDCVGLDVLQLAKQHDRELPVIFVTRTIGEELAIECLRQGASNYILKDRLYQLPLAVSRALQDIEQRQRLIEGAEKLQASELRFRQLVESSSDLLWEMDTHNCFSYLSPRFEGLTGYPPEQWLGRCLFELMPIEEGPKVQRQLDSYTRKRRPFSMLLKTYLHQDGHQIILESSGAPILDSNDALLGYRGIDRDVTERHNALQSFFEVEERFHFALNSIRDALIMIGGEWGQIIEWNPAAEKMFGYSWQEVMGLELHKLIAPVRFRDAFQKAWPTFQASGQGPAMGKTLELTALNRDGKEFPIELSLSAIRYNDQWQAVGIIRDITERMASDDMLFLQANRSEALLELPQLAEGRDERSFLQHALEVAENLTSSQIAFIHFINEDQQSIELATWSKRTQAHYCNASFDQHYPLSQAGIWADALRQRSPVVFNNYVEYPDKQGLPEGHSTLIRLVSLPVIENGKVVMLTGVGNKSSLYNDTDVETVQLVSNEIWRIVKRRRLEQELRNSASQISSILRAAPVGIGSVVQQRVTEINDAYAFMSGFAREELIGRSMQQLFANESTYQQVEEQLYRLIAADGLGQLETRLQRKDGEPIDVILSGAYTDPNEPDKGITICYQDISERKRSETQLRKLALAVEQSTESIVITNLKAEIEYVNQAFMDNSGYTADEIIGQNPRMLQSGKTPQATYTDLWRTLTAGQPWKGQLINRRKNGSEFTEFSQIIPLRDDAERITHYVAIKDDITERKRLGEELDRHRERLEELVTERTLQLQSALEKAEAATMAKAAFLANMSHEIRTPMNAVIGFTHLLRKSSDNPQQMQQIDKIADSAKHLLAIINDILDISKVEAGKLHLEALDFALGAVLEHVSAMVKPQIEAKGLHLRVEKHQVPEWLHGDATRLRQALLNYVGNAVKFTESGSICIRVTTLDEDQDGLLIQFEVEDEGIGIEPALLSKVFLAFEQAESGQSKRYEGTGLGLAITQRLAQLMGGSVGAASEPGKGSRFWFSVRLKRGMHPPPASLTQPIETTESSKHHYDASILLVEDNAINREVAEGLLSGMGLRITSAENGRIALEKLRESAFDLVLMDLQMPEMNGLDATRLIRRQKQHQQLPILAMTANVFEEDRKQCLAVGMNDFVAKPIDPENLFQALDRWLPESTYREEPAQSENGTDPVETSPPSEQEAHIKASLAGLPGLDLNTGLRNLNGNISAYLRLLQQFDNAHNQDMQQVQQALQQGQPEQGRHLAHAIKGVAGTLGLTDLQEAARQLELALKQHDDAPQPMILSVAALQASLHEVLGELQPLAPAASPSDAPQDLDKLLQQLTELLNADDTGVNDLFLDAESALITAYGEQAQQLGEAIESFDYPGARQIISQMHR
jgi:two-component system sensor histidine kinase/response regulator